MGGQCGQRDGFHRAAARGCAHTHHGGVQFSVAIPGENGLWCPFLCCISNDALQSICQGQQVLDGSSYLCAGPGGNGPCAGDAGSALVAFSAGEFRQVGVVSRSTGSSCGAGDSFGVYTLVGPYRDLIQNSINEPLYAGMAVRVHASLGLLLGLLFLGWLL